MARIPDERDRAAKEEIPIERLVTASGCELKRHGADLIGLCPVPRRQDAVAGDHAEEEPVALPGRVQRGRLGHRLGDADQGRELPACGGTAARRSSFFSRRRRPRGAEGHRRRSSMRRSTADADDQEALRQVVDYYHETLKESPEALRYLEGRGLTHPEMIEHFQLGFANRTLGYRLPEKNRKERRGDARALAAARHPARERATSTSTARLVIPVLRSEGDVLGDLRPQDHDEPARGNAAAPLPAGSASRRVERRGAAGVEGNHPVRIADRRADVLVRGLPQRDGELTA